MLQIISGKFFESDDCYVHDGKGITYSNYLLRDSIETCIASLEPVDLNASITPYVINYTNKIERNGLLVRVDDAEIIEQFQLLCIFGLKSFFNVDRNRVELNCRKNPKDGSDKYLPSKFVRRFFDLRVRGNKDETEYFKVFVEQIIGLKREIYNSVINCLYNFFNALQSINYNIDLAYSMLIYSLESLSQNFYEFEPTWNDYYPNVRHKLDKELSSVERSKSKNIKNILLTNSHLKLQLRFVNFIKENIDDSFFSEEAVDLNHPLRNSEIKKVLKNAYNIRSSFVHSLEPIRKQLKDPDLSNGEVFYWGNEPYLTFGGLVRLTHHVITNFVFSQQTVDQEKYNWKSEIPGINSLPLAPQYWLGNHKNYNQNKATKRLSSFLSHLQRVLIEEIPMIDLTNLLKKFETIIPQAKKENKIRMLTMYTLFNFFVKEEDKLDSFNSFISKHETIFNESSIESMLLCFLTGKSWSWEIENCEKIYLSYLKKKFHKLSLKLPQLMEVALALKIANLYLKNSEKENYIKWINFSINELPGKKQIQNTLKHNMENEKEINVVDILFK